MWVPYPVANGQTYGGDMPVEESGNMLVLATAIAIVDGNADYAAQHWEVLTTWANYLLKEGLDPKTNFVRMILPDISPITRTCPSRQLWELPATENWRRC